MLISEYTYSNVNRNARITDEDCMCGMTNICRYSKQLLASGSLYIEPFGFGMNSLKLCSAVNTFVNRFKAGFKDS